MRGRRLRVMDIAKFRNHADREKGQLVRFAVKRIRGGVSDGSARKNSLTWRRWLAVVQTVVAAAIAAASFVTIALSGTALAQAESESPGFEYTSQGSPYEETILEETTPEGTAIWEEPTAGQGISNGIEQYEDSLSRETLTDTGGVAPWAVGVGLALLAIIGLMVFSSGLIRGGGISGGRSENRRGGSRHE
jgi:hypothetical protein